MPRRSLTKDQLKKFWDTFPYGDHGQRMQAIVQFEREHGQLLPEDEKRTALWRYSPELKAKLGITKRFWVDTDIGEQEALKLCGTTLDESHYDLLLNETGIIDTPALEGPDLTPVPLCILLKNVLPQSLLDEVRPIVRKAATQRKIAGGNRGVAAGTGMVERRRSDGSKSNIKGAQKLKDLNDADYARLRSATDGTFGFNARGVRGGQVYPCRITHYSGAQLQDFVLMGVLAKTVADSFRNSWASDRWEAQFAKAGNTAPTWLIRTSEGITPFTTITCNRSWRTAAHVDKGDLKEGYGVLCCLGDFEGCDLVFPRYRAAVRFREGDVLLANVHQVHGNTPLLNPDGSVPEVDREPERLSCVFYYAEKMEQCELTNEKEHEFINKRERGQSMTKKKAKGAAKA
jgi:hypothetical protein